MAKIDSWAARVTLMSSLVEAIGSYVLRCPHTASDVRRAAMNGLAEQFGSAALIFHSVAWNRTPDQIDESLNILRVVNGTSRPGIGNERLLDDFVKVGLLDSTYMLTDHLFGKLADTLNLRTNERANAVDVILRHLQAESDRPAFRVLRTIRNSLHNNGVNRFPGFNCTIDGRSFDVKAGEPITCASWDDLAIVFHAVVHSTVRVLDHGNVVRLPLVVDVSTQWWNDGRMPPGA